MAAAMLETSKDRCPCCGEMIELVIDTSVDIQEYVEDCEVCCCPILVNVTVTDDGWDVTLEQENA